MKFRATLVLHLLSLQFFSLVLLAGNNSEQWQVRPLANDYYELYRSPDPENISAYTPSLAKCPNGRIVATYELWGKKVEDLCPYKGEGNGRIHVSDDHGKTWQYITNFHIWHARAFVAGECVYVLGHRDDLMVMRSDDWGTTWSNPVELSKDQHWHASATNVWYKEDYVYLVMERRTKNRVEG